MQISLVTISQGQRSLKRSDQIEFLAVFTGEDGRLLVVLDQLVHGGKMPLTDAEDAVKQLDLKVFVLPCGFQRDGEVTGLEGGKSEKKTEEGKREEKKKWSEQRGGKDKNGKRERKLVLICFHE